MFRVDVVDDALLLEERYERQEEATLMIFACDILLTVPPCIDHRVVDWMCTPGCNGV